MTKFVNTNGSTDFSILIVEDDYSFGLELEILIREIGYSAIERVDNSEDVLSRIQYSSPNLILMNIDLHREQGAIGVAERIKHLSIPIIFMTNESTQNLNEHSLQTSFCGYLSKPVNKFSIRGAIDLVMQKLNNQNNMNSTTSEHTSAFNGQYFFFKKRGTYHKILTNKVLYVRADDDYTIVYTDDQIYNSTLRLKELVSMLKDFGFMRIHRSYLVNTKRVSTINLKKNYLRIADHQVPFSRRMKVEVLKRLSLNK